nr:hypothetical protein [Tanacetum cinerariifolium]
MHGVRETAVPRADATLEIAVYSSKDVKVWRRLRRLKGGFTKQLERYIFRIAYNNNIIEACEAVTTKRFRGSGHEALGSCDQKPLKAVLFCIIPCSPVHGKDEELQVVSLLEDARGSSEGERNICKELYDEGYHETLYSVIIYSSSEMIPVMEWSGGNLTEGINWEAERLNAISKMLSGRLCERLDERLYLVSPKMFSFIVESSRMGTCSEPREDSKLVGALEPVGAL